MVGAEAGEHGFEALTIFLGDGDETKAKPAATFYVTDDGVGLDAALLNEEIEFGRHAFFEFRVRSLDEEAVDTYVENAGDVVAAIAAPANPNVLGGWKASKRTTRVRGFLNQSGLLEAAARR
jgi:hypothetical protein